jgi:Domain of unknown function (DUF1707)
MEHGPMEQAMRASDADRQRAVAALERHTAEGRLSLDEFAERVDRVLAARTHGELAAITRDLPAESTVDHSAGVRHLAIAFLLAFLALVVIGVAVAIWR